MAYAFKIKWTSEGKKLAVPNTQKSLNTIIHVGEEKKINIEEKNEKRSKAEENYMYRQKKMPRESGNLSDFWASVPIASTVVTQVWDTIRC